MQVEAARAAALTAQIAEIGKAGRALDATALGVVDAVLAGDAPALQSALAAVRERRRDLLGAAPDSEALGALEALASLLAWALERVPTPADDDLLAEGTVAARFLAALAGRRAVGSAEIRERIGTDVTQVSRAGRRLLDAGLVVRTKVGRSVSWALSPRGRRALDESGAGPAVAGPPRRRGPIADDAPGAVAWWREVIRGAWAGDLPDTHEPTGDPERDRIVGAAMELHLSQGVLGTTWPDIARRAGVPTAAVGEHFPTLEDLVPECGGLSLRRLRVPPPGAAEATFAGQDLDARLHALVETLFDLYERGDLDLEVIRRYSDELPVLAHANEAVEESLDGLVVAALRPLEVDGGRVGVLRALAGPDVWRALRDDGGVDAADVAMVARALREALQPGSAAA